ncbi:hypothetical protein B0H16DRAFT_1684762 [Mycena metata]|uniref:Uncharacterized protein n=1 Tax=Mycena metata TaxID=1033252 RepID=A0AAD7JZQ3_9AGAR|nr:hypothetical protein B0H16DRAFT_1684762 [Mycena metata]
MEIAVPNVDAPRSTRGLLLAVGPRFYPHWIRNGSDGKTDVLPHLAEISQRMTRVLCSETFVGPFVGGHSSEGFRVTDLGFFGNGKRAWDQDTMAIGRDTDGGKRVTCGYAPTMDDGEQDSLHAVLRSDNTVLVATTIATLFLAGSALICRSGRRLSFSPHSAGLSLTSPTSQADSDAKKHPNGKNNGNSALSGSDDAKDAKNARSKERRRRGKDPLKEILKGGKKLKMLSVVSRDRDDTGSSTSASTSPLPQTMQSGSSQRSASISTSSRSVSSSTASSSVAAAAGLNMTELTPRNDSEDADTTVRMPPPPRKPRGRAQAVATSVDTIPNADPGLRDISEIAEPPTISISSSSSASTSASLTTAATSPSASPSDKSSSGSTVLLQPSQSYYPSAPNPWDWDGQGPAEPETVYCKPPRFRSKSRGSPGPSSSAPFASTSTAAYSPAPPSSSSLSSEEFTFPTLNAAPSPTSAPEPRPILGGTNSGTPRRLSTPRRVPTPGSGGNTPPPSLNTQTQIASLRGALEAARMREEKARADLDRYAKDFEMMRWENNTWRRRELEVRRVSLMLQAQIHHLMHQLQGYAALFASSMAPGQPHPHMQGSSGPGSPNAPSPGYPGMFSPPMLSPLGVNGQQPQQPFFAYPAPMPGGPPPPPPPQQQTLFSMLFPNGTLGGTGSGSGAGSGSGHGSGSGPPSSVSGSAGSSVGSVSPDLVGSPAPADRGRRRTRTQTAEARLGMGGGTWEGDEGEGWVGIEAQDEEHEHVGEHGEDEPYEDDLYEEDSGFSDVLADAILKRPESIRVRSRRSTRRDSVKDKPPQEFTYPSISDFGNVHGSGAWGGGPVTVATVVVPEPEIEAEVEAEEAVVPAAEGQPKPESLGDPNEDGSGSELAGATES